MLTTAPLFTPQQVIGAHESVDFVASAADLNGDGKLDVIGGDGGIYWHQNLGGGTFASRQEIAPHTQTDGLRAAVPVDLDADGHMDLITGSFYDNTIAWYRNDGSGASFTKYPIFTGAAGCCSVVIADVDGDTHIDVVSSSRNDSTVRWHRNDGTPLDGGWTTHTVQTGVAGAVSVFAADINGDDQVDVLSAAYDEDSIRWYQNDGTPGDAGEWDSHAIDLTVSGAWYVSATDLDGDGDQDALSAAFDGDAIAWHENMPGGWNTHTIDAAADGATSVYPADLDGDGDTDLLGTAHDADRVMWYENDGSENFTAHVVTPLADRAFAVIAADISGDGDLDAVSVSAGDNKLAWYANNVAPSFLRAVERQKLVADLPLGPTQDARFGAAVAVDGEFAVVGAYLEDAGADRAGAAYVYQREDYGNADPTDDTWQFHSRLVRPGGNPSASDTFGRVAIDTAGPDEVTVVVGADGVNAASGAVYVFEWDGADWTSVELTGDGGSNDAFGEVLAIDGDTLVVGNRFDEVEAQDSGTAYVFTRSGSGWSAPVKLTANQMLTSDSDYRDMFGVSVDVDGDTIVVGAYRDDPAGLGADAGAAYVFQRVGAVWNPVRKLTADVAAGARFGTRLSLHNDRLVVSAPRDSEYGINTGATFVFERNQGGTDNWGQTARLSANDLSAEDLFGNSVAVQGDTILVAATANDVGGERTGSAYVFDLENGEWIQRDRLVASDGAASDDFGFPVAMDGDVAFVGARLHAVQGLDEAGAVYVYGLERAPLSVTPGVINEGESVTLTGEFFSSRPGDTHTVIVDWGNGTQSVALPAGERSFSIEHTYADDPAGPGFAPYTIVATVVDQDGATTAANTTQVGVVNVPPTVTVNAPTFVPLGEPTVGVEAIVVDPGDTEADFTYEWDIEKNGAEYATGAGRATGFTPDGEGVYEAIVTVHDGDGGVTTASAFIDVVTDLGDAPDSYHTSLANNGPRHDLQGPRLGAHRDGETDANGTLDGFGDDVLPLGAPGDEDGVTFTALSPGEAGTATVEIVGGNSRIYAWFDFNADGDFSDAGEQIADGSIVLNEGLHDVHFAVPASAPIGTTFARFRLTNDTGVAVTGRASDGEVEDYAVPILADPNTIRGTKFHDINGNSRQDAGEPGLPGWTIYLDENGNRNRDAGEPVSTSAADGSYAFVGIPDDTYRVAEIHQPGWLQVLPRPVPGGGGLPQSFFVQRTGIPETVVGGSINTDTVWTRANAPYHVTSNVTIEAGVTLTVEPGVEVLFDADTRLHVRGDLRANGTAEFIIQFTSSQNTPGIGDWDGIVVDATAGGNASISFATIEYSDIALDITGTAAEMPVFLEHSTLRHNTLGLGGAADADSLIIRSLFLQNVTAVAASDVQIIDSRITDNTIGLDHTRRVHVVDSFLTGNNTAINSAGDGTLVEYSWLGGNDVGVVHSSFGEAQLRNNSIAWNDVGVQFNAGSTNLLHNNNIWNNEPNVQNLTSDPVNATDNYWGTIHSPEIAEGIVDQLDDPASGPVTFKPFAKSQVPRQPLDGSHTVTVAGGSVVENIDFGSRLKVAASFVAALQELDEDAGVIEIDAQLSESLTVETQVQVRLSGTAEFERDYLVADASLVFPAGSTTSTLVVSILDDERFENPDTLMVTLLENDAVTPGAVPTHTVEINDNDAIPQVSFQTAAQLVSEDVGTVHVGVRLTSESDSDVTVPLIFGGTAVAPDDYTVVGGSTITVPAGSLSASTTLTVYDEDLPEGAERIAIQLGTITGGVPSVQAGDPLTQTIIIRQNDRPSVSFRLAGAQVSEGTGVVTAILELSEPSPLAAVTVPVIVSALSDAGGADFVAGPNTHIDFGSNPPAAEIVVPQGQTTGELKLDISSDVLDEPDETLVLNILSSTSVEVGASPLFTLTIQDDDEARPYFSIEKASRWENEGSYELTVHLTNPSTQDIAVPLSFSKPRTSPFSFFFSNRSNLASLESDVAVSEDPIVIKKLESSASRTITILQDTKNERTETLEVSLRASNVVENKPSNQFRRFELKIKDDDPYVTINKPGILSGGLFTGPNTIVEPRTGQFSLPSLTPTSKSVSVLLSAPSNQPVTVPIQLSGSAKRGADYIDSLPSNLTVTINPGDTRSTFTVYALEDGVDDSSLTEDVRIRLQQPANALLGSKTQRTLYIKDADGPPVAYFELKTQSVPEGRSAAVNVFLNRASDQVITVPIRLAAKPRSTAEKSDHDFRNSKGTLTFLPGNIYPENPISVEILKNKDGRFDWFDYLVFDMQTPTNADRGKDRTHVIYIRDKNRSSTVSTTYTAPPAPQTVAYQSLAIDTSKNPAGAVPSDSSVVLQTGSGSTINPALTLIVDTNAGYLVGSTTFFDANQNGVRDFLDLNDDGVQSVLEPSEPFETSSGDGTVALAVPTEFDRDYSDAIEPHEGRWVVSGGTDAATLLPFVGQFRAVPGHYVLSPISTLISELVSLGFTADDAQTRTLEALNVPGNIDTRTLQPSTATLHGDTYGALLYATNAMIFDTTVQAASVFTDVTGAPPMNMLIDLAYADLAAKIYHPATLFDATQVSHIESLLSGLSFATGIQIPSNVLADAATVIAAGNAAIDEFPESTDLAYLEHVTRVERVAQGEVATDLRAAGASGSSGSLVADYTGANLDSRIADATIGNVLPPGLVITDVTQSENDSGQQVFDFTVALKGESVVPVTVDYATADHTATEGEDYVATSGSLSWAAGDNTDRTIQVTVNGDNVPEPDELFILALTDPQNAVLRKDLGYGWIFNDDAVTHSTAAEGSSNELDLRLNGEEATLRDGDDVILSGFHTDPLDVTITGHDDVDDELTISFTDETYRADTISFAGGSGGVDTARILGGEFDSITHTLLNDSDGTTLLDPVDSDELITLSWTGLEPFVLNVGHVEDLVFELPPGTTTTILEDADPIESDGLLEGMMQLRSPNGHFETTLFASPAGSLTIRGGNGGDIITIASLDPSFTGDLLVDGDALGSDPVALSVVPLTIEGNVEFDVTELALSGMTIVGTASLSGTAVVDGDAVFQGNTSFAGPTSLDQVQFGGDVAFSADVEVVDAVAVAGDVEFSGSAARVNSTLEAGLLTVAAGTTLSGVGTVDATVTVASSGAVDPGTNTGILTTGPITFAAGSSFQVQANGTTAGGAYDQLATTGLITLNNPTLDLVLGYTPASGDSYRIVDNQSAQSVSGTFNGLANGAGFKVGTTTFEIDYGGGDGNDITLTVVNTPPLMDEQSFSINENLTAVGTVQASDAELPGDTLTFELTGDGADNARFAITEAGQLSFVAAPDYEQPSDTGGTAGDNVYLVEVRVEDSYGETETATMTVTVDATNDNSPAFTSSSAASVAENTTAVQTIAATDADLPAQSVTYSISGGADQGKFTITDGDQLKFAAAPDFEAPGDANSDNVYEVQVKADDGNGLTTTQTVLVTVTAVNDNSPAFTSAAAESVAENTTAVQTIAATDADQPAQSVTYSISGGADQAKFTITDGDQLKFAAAPDFEAPGDANTDNVYEVQVKADDGNGLTTTQTVLVTVTAVNDNAPVFTSAAAESVAENTTAVQTIAATDGDLPAQSVTYSISGGADQAKFTITDGDQLKFAAAPDFESPGDANSDNVYEVQVKADDGNGLTTTQTVLVTVTAVNDNAPVFTSSAAASVAENTTAVQTIAATDADLPAQSITYSISGGADQGKFTITDGDQLKFAAAPDFEALGDANSDNIYEVQVKADDGNGLTTTQTVLVTVTAVNDNAPAFTSAAAESVAENTTAVQTIAATDADLPAQSVTYSISGGADQAKFTITGGDQLKFAAAPDFETPGDANSDNVYEVQVKADDGNGLTTTQTVLVTVTAVNDNAPAFTSAAAESVAENTTAVQTVAATDADLPAQSVTYFISGGADQARFTITDGDQLKFAAAPDFETPGDANSDNVYEVQVKADDGNGLSTTQTVLVTVTAVNDNAPVFTSAAAESVAENTTAVQTVAATDADLPAQSVTYSISGGADQARFTITGDDQLKFAAAPDFETPGDASSDNVYEVQVKADDGNGLTTTQTVLVTVDPVNESPTAVADSTATNENTSIATDVIANDADVDAGDVLSLVAASASISSATLDSDDSNIAITTASITQSGNSITFNPGTDFDFLGVGQAATVLIEYTVTDNGTPPLTDIGTLAVTVTGTNDGHSIYVLNPHRRGTLSLSGHASINLAEVYVNSNSSKAIRASGHASINADAVKVVGGVHVTGDASINPQPTQIDDSVADPLASMPEPAIEGTDRGSFICWGNQSHTLSPGLYKRIWAAGHCDVTLLPGNYIVQGRGIIVVGHANISGSEVLLYNTSDTNGRNGGIFLGGHGSFNLTPPVAGDQAGVVIFQDRDNSRRITLRGGSTMAGVQGTVYAPAAKMSISGRSETHATLIVDRLRLRGSAGAKLVMSDDLVGDNGEFITEGQLLRGEVVVAIDHESDELTADETARFAASLDVLNTAFNAYGVELSAAEAGEEEYADVRINIAATSPCGDKADGVLGCTAANGQIILIDGWNWYSGADGAGVTEQQYDFQTIVTHELGHALGLGHSADGGSVMNPVLADGQSRRMLTTNDLTFVSDHEDEDEALMAHGFAPVHDHGEHLGQLESGETQGQEVGRLNQMVNFGFVDATGFLGSEHSDGLHARRHGSLAGRQHLVAPFNSDRTTAERQRKFALAKWTGDDLTASRVDLQAVGTGRWQLGDDPADDADGDVESGTLPDRLRNRLIDSLFTNPDEIL